MAPLKSLYPGFISPMTRVAVAKETLLTCVSLTIYNSLTRFSHQPLNMSLPIVAKATKTYFNFQISALAAEPVLG